MAKKKAKRERTKDGDAGRTKEEEVHGSSKSAPAACVVQEEKQDKPDASEQPSADQEAYMAAAVVFFTRSFEGSVSKVLLAVEDRKVQASYIGLTQKGKVIERMLVFPMGRKEKKDKSDPVETAKREYVEETGDFGGLSKYLDFAEFDDEDGSEQECSVANSKGKDEMQIWKGNGNMALRFAPASMVAMFCHVPESAVSCEERRAEGGIQLVDDDGLPPGVELTPGTEQTPKKGSELAVSDEQAGETSAPTTGKKRKRERGDGCKPLTYIPGKTDHLSPAWVDASSLVKALAAKERAPAIQIEGEGECRLFPTSLALLKMPEARAWLGAPPIEEKTSGEKTNESAQES